MNASSAAPHNMPLDMARRTLVQREALASTANSGRVQALSAIAPVVFELAKGFDFNAESAREALVAQQLTASEDIWFLSQEVAPDDRAAMTMASHQTLAKAIAASGDLSEGSRVRATFDALPADLRSAVSISEMNTERSPMRPS